MGGSFNNNQNSIKPGKPYTLTSFQDGFTLVELLVTILVAVILVTSLSTIVSNNTFLAQQSRDLIVANSFAENKFEEIRSKGYLSLTNTTTDITNQLPSELNNPRSASVTISDVSTGLKLITVSITYNQTGKQQTYTYKSYIGELGVAQY